jgi:SNF2 family DNA or RNA helicase
MSEQVRLIDTTHDRNNDFLVKFPFDRQMADDLRQTIPTARWVGGHKAYVVPAAPEPTEALIKWSRLLGFKASQAARDQMVSVRERATAMAELARSMDTDLVIEVEGLTKPLKEYQKAGIAYLLRTRRSFLADEQGLGKMIESLCVVKMTKAWPCVIICKGGLRLNWRDEIRMWMPDATVSVIDNAKSDFSAQYLIISFGSVHKHLDTLKALGPKAIIVDECHHHKERTSQRSKSAYHLSRRVPIRLLLSGTPLINRPAELIMPLQILGRLDELGGYDYFMSHYCFAVRRTMYDKRKGTTRTFWEPQVPFDKELQRARSLELNEKLRQMGYIRRLRREVNAELPLIQRVPVRLEITNRTEYDRARDNIVKHIGQLAVDDPVFLRSLAGMPPLERNAAIYQHRHQAESRGNEHTQLREIDLLQQLAGRGKMEAVKEWVADMTGYESDGKDGYTKVNGEGEKLILFVFHRAFQQELASAFPGCAHILGTDESTAIRQANVNRFQDDPDCKLIVCSLEVANAGYTLTAAYHVAFAQLGWTPAIHRQAESRCYGRANDPHGATAWYLLAADTIEEKMAALINAKADLVDDITEGDTVADADQDSDIMPGIAADLAAMRAA